MTCAQVLAAHLQPLHCMHRQCSAESAAGQHLKHCVCPAQQRQKAFVNYKDYIGRDITSLVTLPVWIMEPYTMLQKVAEIMEHTELLDRAAVTEDPYERRALSKLSW